MAKQKKMSSSQRTELILLSPNESACFTYFLALWPIAAQHSTWPGFEFITFFPTEDHKIAAAAAEDEL